MWLKQTGKDVGESRAFYSQAKRLLTTPRTDTRERSAQSEIQAEEKGTVLFTSRNTDRSFSPSAAKRERKATWFSCQRGNKPLALEKASRTRRKKTDPEESSVANKVKSTQTKSEWEFLFSSSSVS